MIATTEIWHREPDGRALYAYKCRDEEYEQLKEMVVEQIHEELSGRGRFHFAAKFCLYAAETFRRRHEGGPWTWETIFSDIADTTPDYPRVYEWVLQGLRWWRRPLLKSHNGDREFLLTLGCEGGLPLRLLRKENAHLNRYFRELLSAYHRERHAPGCNATDVARQVAVHYLPTSLRHDVVFNLSGDLIQSIVQLQTRVADAADPIASLRPHSARMAGRPAVASRRRHGRGTAEKPGRPSPEPCTDGTAALALALLSCPQGGHWSIAQQPGIANHRYRH